MWKEEGLYSAKEFANWGNVASGENLKYTPLRQREAAFYRESSAQVPDWSNDMQMRESNHPVLIGIKSYNPDWLESCDWISYYRVDLIGWYRCKWG